MATDIPREYRVDPDNPAHVVYLDGATSRGGSVLMWADPFSNCYRSAEDVEGWTRLIPAPAPAAARMVDTLRLIAGDRCETYWVDGWSCPDSGRDRISTTGTADQWCDACRAADALGLIPTETSRV